MLPGRQSATFPIPSLFPPPGGPTRIVNGCHAYSCFVSPHASTDSSTKTSACRCGAIRHANTITGTALSRNTRLLLRQPKAHHRVLRHRLERLARRRPRTLALPHRRKLLVLRLRKVLKPPLDRRVLLPALVVPQRNPPRRLRPPVQEIVVPRKLRERLHQRVRVPRIGRLRNPLQVDLLRRVLHSVHRPRHCSHCNPSSAHHSSIQHQYQCQYQHHN